MPKHGNSKSVKNFRPICLTSNIGKVVEAVVRASIIDNIESALPQNMYGFRKGRSTADALTKVMDSIRSHRAKGRKVAVLALDATAAFDTLNHQIIIESLKRMGAGPRMLAWTTSFLEDCEYFVQIGSTRSSSWVCKKAGVGQGKKFSPDLYNVGTASQSFWCDLIESAYFADDGSDVVFGDTEDECQLQLQDAANKKAEWFESVGLTLNVSKSEILGFGFSPNPISINNQIISPSTSIKFLGLIIQADLKWDQYVSLLCNKIRWAAGRIRSEGRLLCTKDRKTLFDGWIMGALHANATVFLPSISECQLSQIQTAVNSGVRAVMNLPRRSNISMTTIRGNLGIQSVEDVRDKCLMLAAHKNRELFNSYSQNLQGPTTRAKSQGDIPHPDQRGHLGKMTSTAMAIIWNKIPKEIREEEDHSKASRMIKKLFKKGSVFP